MKKYIRRCALKTPVFKGSCTAIITPFTNDGIDYAALVRQLDRQAAGGTKALLVAGTTGESTTLNADEYESLIDFCVKYVSGRMTIIAGIGGNNTADCCKKGELAARLGVDALTMTTPYYNKSTQEGIVRHFTYVADRIDLPLILYNVPSRTSVGITLDSYKRLAEHPNINGVKEASGDISLIAKLRAYCGNNLYIWSGNDDNTVPIMSIGGLGVISVASNVIPGEITLLCDLCLGRNFTAATEGYVKYADLFEKLFIETNPIPVKKAMELLGLDSGLMRLPLVEMSGEAAEKLVSTMKRCEILK